MATEAPAGSQCLVSCSSFRASEVGSGAGVKAMTGFSLSGTHSRSQAPAGERAAAWDLLVPPRCHYVSQDR